MRTTSYFVKFLDEWRIGNKIGAALASGLWVCLSLAVGLGEKLFMDSFIDQCRVFIENFLIIFALTLLIVDVAIDHFVVGDEKSTHSLTLRSRLNLIVLGCLLSLVPCAIGLMSNGGMNTFAVQFFAIMAFSGLFLMRIPSYLKSRKVRPLPDAR